MEKVIVETFDSCDHECLHCIDCADQDVADELIEASKQLMGDSVYCEVIRLEEV